MQGSKEAVPIIQALLNYTQEQLASDASKKLYGFYPDIQLSKEQRQDKSVAAFLRDLHSAVTNSYLEGIVEYYNKGGMEWQDSTGIVRNLVPVIAFLTTDMKEARAQKGLFQAWKCRMPCHMCTVAFEETDTTFFCEDASYRNQSEIISALESLGKAER